MSSPAAKTDITLEFVGVNALQADGANPRRISPQELEALTKSVQEFGLVDPVIARRADGMVIGGHQRLLAARRLGMATVPVVFVDLSIEQARLLNLALNRISGEWDEELLAHLVKELEAVSEVDLGVSGFDEGELKKLLKSIEVRERRDRPDAFDLEEALKAALTAPVAQRGDLWRLGDHTLMCGDATDSGDVARLMEGQKAQVAFTDPPYNVAYGDHGGHQGKRRRIKNDQMSAEQWEAFIAAWSQNLLQSVDGAVYVCMSTREWASVSRALANAGGHWSDTIVWAKDRFVLGRADYQRQYEPIWYGWPEGAKRQWLGGRDQGDIWNLKRPASSELHPTTKPLELVERALANSSRQGDVVLDLFSGSGTTLMVAERTGRTCRALELDPYYCQVAVSRWEAFTGRKAVKEVTS